jgi:hypothetical protein
MITSYFASSPTTNYTFQKYKDTIQNNFLKPFFFKETNVLKIQGHFPKHSVQENNTFLHWGIILILGRY